MSEKLCVRILLAPPTTASGRIESQLYRRLLSFRDKTCFDPDLAFYEQTFAAKATCATLCYGDIVPIEPKKCDLKRLIQFALSCLRKEDHQALIVVEDKELIFAQFSGLLPKGIAPFDHIDVHYLEKERRIEKRHQVVTQIDWDLF